MTIRIDGTIASASVTGGDKYRVTWYRGGLFGITFRPAPVIASDLQKALPMAGFIPVSNITAVDGDDAIVFDVRLATTWSGRIVADIVNALDRLDVPGANLAQIAKLGTASSSTTLAEDQEEARKQANEEAEDANVFAQLANTLKDLAGKLATGAGVTIVLVALGVGTYLYVKRRR